MYIVICIIKLIISIIICLEYVFHGKNNEHYYSKTQIHFESKMRLTIRNAFNFILRVFNL